MAMPTDEDGSSLYGHDSRSILSASTSSRVTLNGPRQRPKGPRTSDISRSSLVERSLAGLPSSPLAKEISAVQEELYTPTQSLSLSRDSISLASPQPRRLSLTRFSFRRSKLKPHVEDTLIGDDPFGSTPHPSVQWTHSGQHQQAKAKPLVADGVNGSPAQIKKSLSLMTPVSQNRADSEPRVPLKSKRSFFRRMADKFTRSQTTHSTESQYQSAPFRDTKQQPLLPYTESPTTIYPAPQLPTPASSIQPPSPTLPSLLVLHPDELSSIHRHQASATRNLSLVKLPESVSLRTLPVIPADETTVNNSTFTPSTSPRKVSNTDNLPYSTPPASASWQPITPISPSTATPIYPIRDPGLSTTHTLYNSFSNNSFPRPAEKCDVGRYSLSSSKQQAASVRSIPIIRDPSPPDRRKATSVRSQHYHPSARFNSNIQPSRKGENSAELRGNYYIREDSHALVNLDKAMFEKELAREKERGPWHEEKDQLAILERKSPETSNPNAIHSFTIPLGKRKSKRQSNTSLNSLGHNKLNRTLPSKPSSAPNPSSSGLKQGLGFSVNLATNFDINTADRLYPDVLYTVNQTTDSLSSLPDITLPGRRSLPTQPLVGLLSRSSSKNREIGEPTHSDHTENGHDKVSRWLRSTTRRNEMDIPVDTSPVTDWGVNNEQIEEVKRYKGKGKALDRGKYNV